jgi:hypothetical protein
MAAEIPFLAEHGPASGQRSRGSDARVTARPAYLLVIANVDADPA